MPRRRRRRQSDFGTGGDFPFGGLFSADASGDRHQHLFDGHRHRRRTRRAFGRIFGTVQLAHGVSDRRFSGNIVRRFGFLFARTRTADERRAVRTNASNADWKTLLSNKSFVLLRLGYALLGLATNNLSIWGATFYSRVHQLDLPTIGFWSGVLTLLAGIPATLFGGAIADWFRRRNRGGRMLYGALLALFSIPFWLLLIFTDNPYLILLSNFGLLFFALAWLGAAAAADATEIAGVNLRGLAIAIYFFTVNIAAYLIGSNLIGFLNDRFGATANPAMMRYALLVCPVSLSAFGNLFMARQPQLVRFAE